MPAGGPSGDIGLSTGTICETSRFNIRIVSDFAGIEPEWRALEADCVMSAYHCFDWLKRWHAHVGKHECAELILAVGEKDGAVAFILPIGIWRIGPLRVARWLGGKLNNYNFGLWRADCYSSMPAGALRDCLTDIARLSHIDAFELLNIPENWAGHRSPFLDLAHTPSPSNSYVMDLDADFDTLHAKHRSSKGRRSQRKKLERLMEAGDVAISHSVDADAALDVINATIEQRSERAADAGIPNAFVQAGVASLFRETVAESAGDAEPVMDTHFLAVDGIIRATYVGGVKNGRYSCALNSFRHDDLTYLSPGDLLLTEVIHYCCERGLTQLDLGIGEMRYKTSWCEPDPLIDCIIPITVSGRLHARMQSLLQAAKRTIKGNTVLWQMVLRLRRLRAHLR